jgi:hypothetical protein
MVVFGAILFAIGSYRGCFPLGCDRATGCTDFRCRRTKADVGRPLRIYEFTPYGLNAASRAEFAPNGVGWPPTLRPDERDRPKLQN